MSVLEVRKSTTDRTRRVAARLIERMLPAAGAALAERLWFTVPTVSTDRNGSPAPIGRPFAVTVGGRSVRGQSWGDGRVVYLVHGWGGWGGQLVAFVQPLVEAGYRVVTFDSLSHGESDPGALGRRRSTLVELADVLAAVVEEHGQPAGIVAHSLGGTATALALRAGLKADRVVLVAPMADPAPYLAAFVRGLGFGRRVLRHTQRLVERRAGLALADIDVPRVAAEVDTPPVLVVHDRDDKEVAWSDGSAIAGTWPDATLLTTTGLGHRRILRDPIVLAEVASFLRHEIRHQRISS